MTNDLKHIWLATITDTSSHAGTDSQIVLIVNQDGVDQLHETIKKSPQKDLESGGANIYHMELFSLGDDYARISPPHLNNSYVRVGIRGSDAWRPAILFVWGQDNSGTIVPLALNDRPLSHLQEKRYLSTDPSDDILYHDGDSSIVGMIRSGPNHSSADDGAQAGSRLSVPVPLLDKGSKGDLIKTVLLLILTEEDTWAGSNSTVDFVIQGSGTKFVDFEIPETPQQDKKSGQANFYEIPVAHDSFTQGDIENIYLNIKGQDAWALKSIFVFGRNKRTCIPLSHMVDVHAILSTDPSEGKPRLNLNII